MPLSPVIPDLRATDLHLWKLDLAAPTADIAACWQSLSDEERKRAEAFRFERHRRRFIAARGQMRCILALYLGIPSQEVPIAYGPAGKPEIDTATDNRPFRFNLSHSEDSAVLVLARDIELGVDIEHIRPMTEDVASLIFSPAEQAQFATIPQASRAEVLLAAWTRKEACLKALGIGLQLPPPHFEFDLLRPDADAPLRVGESSAEAAEWKVLPICAPENCAGAVAMRNRGLRLVSMPKPSVQQPTPQP